MTTTEPVRDWAADYDLFDPRYVTDPYTIWEAIRPHCPVAHSDRWGGSWNPLSYDLVNQVAHDTQHFTSESVVVTPPVIDESDPYAAVAAPQITSDPPDHIWHRRLLLPPFSPKSVEQHEEFTRELCRALLRGFIEDGQCDAANQYAKQIPAAVIAHMIGIPDDRRDTFAEWVRMALELGLTDPDTGRKGRDAIIGFFIEQLIDRKSNPRDDLISYLLAQKDDQGQPVEDIFVIGMLFLLLIAGIDTTWSSIGAALWHLAQHPEDRRRLVAEPELLPLAIEEFLRAYSPVTMARLVKEDVEIGGCPFKAGDRVLLNFPAANRDPSVFERADEVVIDREVNRHIAFGAGIHRCAGSNLARMEMRIAIEEWLKMIPEFSLAEPGAVTWAGGQVRGPRALPVNFHA